MKKKDVILTIIFLMVLFVPSILYLFLYNNLDHNNYENRLLYEKPKLELSKIESFPEDYENYYNDHLPFKNEIRMYYASFLYNWINTSSNSRVVIGKDKWLFYNSKVIEDNDNIGDYRKITKYTLEEKDTIKNNIVNIKNKLDNKGIDFYLFMASNKETIYSDYMPDIISVDESVELSRTDELVNYLNKETNIDIIYPKEKLIKERSVVDTYFKYDTHWNYYGAYIGVMELMKTIDPNFNIPKIELGKIKYRGDLPPMLGIPSGLLSVEPCVVGFYDDVNYRFNENGKIQEYSSEKYIYDKTLFLIGDSFSSSMLPYLAKLYKNLIYIHRDNFEDNMIDLYNPNIVILQTTERAYSSLIYFKI